MTLFFFFLLFCLYKLGHTLTVLHGDTSHTRLHSQTILTPRRLILNSHNLQKSQASNSDSPLTELSYPWFVTKPSPWNTARVTPSIYGWWFECTFLPQSAVKELQNMHLEKCMRIVDIVLFHSKGLKLCFRFQINLLWIIKGNTGRKTFS